MGTPDSVFASEANRGRPTFIKFDIEGGATHALRGYWCIFRDGRALVLIESHTPEDRTASNVPCDTAVTG
jgi:hypothetical protein